jgi:hypothetical protein
MNLTATGHEGVEWIHKAQGWDMRTALVNAVKNFRVPKSVGYISISSVTVY